MKYPVRILLVVVLFWSCRDDDDSPRGFSEDEIFPVVSFTWKGAPVRITSAYWGGRFFSQVRTVEGAIIPDLSVAGFMSIIDSSGIRSGADQRYQFIIGGCQHVTESQLDRSQQRPIPDVDPVVFKELFRTGERKISPLQSGLQSPDEMVIWFKDQDAELWSTGYQGDIRFIPPYHEFQPGAKFTIERSMPFGDDSVFVEIRFRARMYRSTSSYVDINDGYFKGFFYRKDK